MNAVVRIVRVVDLHVDPEVNLACEMAIANRADVAVLLIVLLLQMAKFMLVEVLLRVEFPLADVTGEQCLRHVNSHVTLQNRSGLEGLRAGAALVAFGIAIAVGSDVLLELPDLNEYLMKKNERT